MFAKTRSDGHKAIWFVRTAAFGTESEEGLIPTTWYTTYTNPSLAAQT